MSKEIPIFTYIGRQDGEEKLESYIDMCLGAHGAGATGVSKNPGRGIDAECFIKKVANAIPGDFTIVTEPHHVDKGFRDTYYMYFASQHFQVDRYCTRITFLHGHYDWSKLLYQNAEDIEKIESDLVGTVVVIPVSGGIIGRSLLKPDYFFSDEGCFLRKSRFTFHMYGIPLNIDAFPYQMQDKETMRCSEVTLLNMMDYYSNTYRDYKSVTPSEIIDSEQKHSHERALPSRGITYHMLTKVMSDLGFSPRLYNLRAMRNDDMSGISQQDELKRLLHYYVESGIPVAVNVEPINGRGIGHSLLCIGHSTRKCEGDLKGKSQVVGNPFEDGFDLQSTYTITDSADFYDRYVVIDDNQFPYTISDFGHMSIYQDMQVTNIAIPLYKRMFMEAADAYKITYEILTSEKWGVFAWGKDYLTKNGIKNIIIRLFLASSRSFKSNRVNAFASRNTGLQMIYEMIRLPQFVWVCELYSEDGYMRKGPQAFAEIILDGTSANKKGINNIIMMKYPNTVYSRSPEEYDADEAAINRINIENDCLIPAYRKNLTYYGG